MIFKFKQKAITFCKSCQNIFMCLLVCFHECECVIYMYVIYAGEHMATHALRVHKGLECLHHHSSPHWLETWSVGLVLWVWESASLCTPVVEVEAWSAMPSSVMVFVCWDSNSRPYAFRARVLTHWTVSSVLRFLNFKMSMYVVLVTLLLLW